MIQEDSELAVIGVQGQSLRTFSRSRVGFSGQSCHFLSYQIPLHCRTMFIIFRSSITWILFSFYMSGCFACMSVCALASVLHSWALSPAPPLISFKGQTSSAFLPPLSQSGNKVLAAPKLHGPSNAPEASAPFHLLVCSTICLPRAQ